MTDAALPTADELFDAAPCGLLLTAADGAILKVNTTFCEWVGVPRERLVGVERLQSLFTMGGRIFHQTHWMPTLQMTGTLAEIKFDVRHSDGSVVPMIFNARRRLRAGRTFDEIAAFVAHERSTYERELMNARKKADGLLEAEQQSQRLLRDRALFAEQMVGIVSHDLRNPLSAILMGVQLLARADNERRVRVLGHVRDSAERAQRLIEELLDFTQARLGRGLAVHRQPMDLHATAARTVEELRLSFPDRTIVCRALGTDRCVADADRLAQLIGNLVGNAVAYGDAQAPIVVTSDVSGPDARLEIHNAGQPIPDALRERIFEPMVRGETGSSAVRSVGLGLFIVSEIARAHGGVMSVTSELQRGTAFTLRFPADLAPT